MKKLERDFIIAWVVGMLLPGVIVWVLAGLKPPGKSPETSSTTQSSTDMLIVPRQIGISVRSLDGTVREMELETYLCGVVLAEMPADFGLEALKAQSVVARTYALRRLERGAKHDSGAVCEDPACCQGYISPEAFLSRGGTETELNKVRRAVLETAGEVLLYGGSLIDATYFSCSGGMTEDAAAVWGAEVPYLQATASPGEEYADHYSDSQSISVREAERALDVSLDGEPENWFEILSFTDGGGVGEIAVCGELFTGVQLRKLLGLRSTNFSVEATKESIIFNTMGYGHRVGMSQYGADAMAVSGSTYAEILAHYYTGTTLEQYKGGD